MGALRNLIQQLGIITLFLALTILIEYKALIYNGFVEWGNTQLPITVNSLTALPQGITWHPFANGGAPAISPILEFLGSSYSIMLFIFGGYWNITAAVKILYVFFLTFYAYTFFLLTNAFSKSVLSRIVATIFVVVNPASLSCITEGNLNWFFWIGFLFLSIYFLHRSVINNAINVKIKYYLLSSLFFTLTLGSPMVYYLGVPIYFLFLFIFVDTKTLNKQRNTIKKFVKESIIALGFLLGESSFFIYDFFRSPVLPSSPIARSLTGYILYSKNVWSVLTMNADPAHPITQYLNPLGSGFISLWVGTIYVLVIFTIFYGALFRNKKILFLSIILLTGSLFAAGAASPIASLNIYLYEHMLGYQLLNDSYMWDFILISPTFSLIVAILLDEVLKNPTKYNERFKGYIVKIAPFALLSLVIIPPIAVQNYYEPSGINSYEAVSSYANLALQLHSLIGSSYQAFSLFPATVGITFNNSSVGFSNPLLYPNEPARIVVPTYWSAPLSPDGFYAYFAYNQFNNKNTYYLSQLLGIVGVKYFVTLNNVDGLGNTESALMQSQKNISLIYKTKYYNIYKNNLNVPIAVNVNYFTIMPSNYNMMLYAANIGINISGMAIVFTQDINSENFNIVINNTKTIIINGNDSLISIALGKYINMSDTINVLKYINPQNANISQVWTSSTSMYNWPYSPNSLILENAYPFILTDSKTPLIINQTLPSLGKYNLWVYVMESPEPGAKLQFNINGALYNVSTYNGTSPGTFFWIKIPFLAKNNSLDILIKSYGYNGIMKMVYLRQGLISREVNKLKNLIIKNNVIVINLKENTLNYSLIKKVNSIKYISSPFEIKITQNGYIISGKPSGIILIRLPFYSTMKPSNHSILQFPSMGGINYYLVLPNGTFQKEIIIENIDYISFVQGIILFIAFNLFVFYFEWCLPKIILRT